MIELKNVTRTYAEGNQSLIDVSLQIKKGEFVFIVGGSGAGKTTLLKLLIAEDKPTSGSVWVAEQSLDNIKRRQIPMFRRKIGIVFRDFRLFTNKTVYENVAFALRVTGEPAGMIRTKVMNSLRMVELADKVKSYPADLTSCEQQRVALARAIVGGPNVIIADEPCGNIDPIESRDLLELFGRLQSRYEKTVVVLTHDREMAESFGHRVIRLHRGEIAEDRAATVSEEILTEEEFSGSALEEGAWDNEVVQEEVTEVATEAVTDLFESTMSEAELELPSESDEPLLEECVKSATGDTIEYDLSKLVASGEIDPHTANDLTIAAIQMLDLPELDADLTEAIHMRNQPNKDSVEETMVFPSVSSPTSCDDDETVTNSAVQAEESTDGAEDSPTVVIPIADPHPDEFAKEDE